MKEKTTTARKRRAKRKHGEIEEHIVDETDDRDNTGRGDEDYGDGDDDNDDGDVLSEDEEDDMSENEEDDNDDDRDENQVGKTGMTPELYKCC